MIRQKRSHATFYNGEIHVTVPVKERDPVGLLKVILEDSGISREEFPENR
ncbi:MAG: type II toxin-antitoxin system HicA family toxin [Thaumarchaeota archaeon]|nr:type II toxin-antitoxin system HicA family toxin [Nitrososphaerota archaeon]